jgi:hypothetical protein
MITDHKVQDVFDSLVPIQVGTGSSTYFWRHRWLDGRAICDVAPGVHAMVSAQCANQHALMNNKWVNGVRGVLSLEALVQCLMLLAMVTRFVRDIAQPD